MNLIFCSDINGAIGFFFNNSYFLCCDFKSDMQNFKTLTSGSNDYPSILIVGYNTYETIKHIKFNSNRILWVLTSKKDSILSEESEFIKFFASYDDLIPNIQMSKHNIWIIGGKQIYEQFESICDYIYHTEVFFNFSIKSNDQLNNNHPNNNYIITYKIPSYYKLIESNASITDINRLDDISYELKFNKYKNCYSSNDYKCDKLIGEYQYLNMLQKTLNSNKRNTRNGFTYSYFGDQIRFDLRDGFPMITTKKMFFKGIAHELLFFLRGSTNTKELEEVGVNIWKGNTNRKFLDDNGFTDRVEGEMGPMYGFQWRHFNNELDQLMNVINEIKTNPTSRRLLLTTYNPLQVHLGVLYPCHSLIIQFYIEEIDSNNYYLSLQMYQRSADVFLGLPFNIASMGLFLEIICNYISDDTIKYIARDVIISLGDVHLYESHYNQAVEQLKRKPLNLCKLKIINKYSKIEDYKLSDLIIENYKSYSAIKAEMVA